MFIMVNFEIISEDITKIRFTLENIQAFLNQIVIEMKDDREVMENISSNLYEVADQFKFFNEILSEHIGPNIGDIAASALNIDQRQKRDNE